MTADAALRYYERSAPKISTPGVDSGVRISRLEEVDSSGAESGHCVLPDPEIEQTCGRRFSAAALLAIRSGNPVDGEALDLVQALWDTVPDPAEAEAGCATVPDAGGDGKWNGLRAAVFIACRDTTLVGKVRTIDYRDIGRGRSLLHVRHLVRCVQQDVARHHCCCAAKKARDHRQCDCLDSAFFLLSDALRRGDLVELGTAWPEPLTGENCWHRLFSSSAVMRLAADRKTFSS